MKFKLIIRLINHSNKVVAQHRMRTVDNMARDSTPNRDALVQLGVVQAVSTAVDDFHKGIKDIQRKVLVNMLNQSSLSIVCPRNLCRLVANLCRHKSTNGVCRNLPAKIPK